jgi:drug/metabolite transporter (DMT)-like permease
LLFTAMSLIWGLPYLLIKVSVDHVDPAVVVAGRTSVAFVLLLPVALHRGALKAAMAAWRWVLLFAGLEMAAPWLLLTDAEQRLPSGLTGLLVATVPLFGATTALVLGDRSVLSGRRLTGLALGVAGVGLLVGFGGDGGTVDARSVVQVLLVAVCYAIGPFVVSHRLADVPPLGVSTMAVGVVAALYLPAGIAVRPDHAPPATTILSIVGLGVICTAIAFLVFFALIDEVGPARSTLITFANPAVAVTLGIVVLGEAVTPGLILGFPVILAACWLASRHDLPAEAGTGDEGDDFPFEPEATPAPA